MTPNLDEELEKDFERLYTFMENDGLNSKEERVAAYVTFIKSREERLVREAREDFATKIFTVKTEGLFNDGDLFIKRRPIEQVVINELGYETYKAIQEAADAALKEGE